MSEIDAKKAEKFMKELTKISRKYGIRIGGCGCCGSPWLMKIDGDPSKGGYTACNFENLSFGGTDERD